MPLVTLQSNLSWYGSNSGFQAPQSIQDTRFNYDAGDLTVAVAPRGFDNAGFQSNAFIPRISSNTFNIDGQGTATRLTQLGTGTKFPIGPEGQIHEFDIKRTGFSINTRYGDTFNNKTLKGLAATYTAASPIDDMYNKYKVREEVHDPYGYAKPPFILKGIQRDGSSDPERYGMPGVTLPSLNVPNGGIIVNATRTADDIARIGKFLIRPDGLMFIAKQQILRQMLPNLEGTITLNPAIPGGSVAKVNPQSLYNPLNTIASILGLPIGVRFRNFGVTPIDDGASRYEDVVVKNRVSDSMKVAYNRLGRLTEEREGSVLSLLPYWNSISSLSGGPDSLGGLGPTIFSKSTRTLDKADQLLNPQYDYTTPYLRTRSGLVATVDASNNDQENIDNRKWSTITINRAYTRRAYTTNIQTSINGQFKSSLKYLGDNRFKNANTSNDIEWTPLTSLTTQLAFHGGEIRGYTDKRFVLSYDTPYLGTQSDSEITNDVITDTNQELDTFPTGLYNKSTDYKKEDSSLKSQLDFHQGEIKNYGNISEIENKITTYDAPYIGDRNDDKITNDIITDEESEKSFKEGSLRVLPENFTAIPQREGSTRAASPVQREGIDLTTYKTLAYSQIPKERLGKGKKELFDFGTGNAWDVGTKPTLESKYGYVSYNKPESKPDPVMNDVAGATDLINFSFTPSDGGPATTDGQINFRAYIISLSDNFTPNWDAQQDQGRADAKIRYQSFTRDISIAFKVVVHSAAERSKVWEKLGNLAKISYPVYGDSGFGGKYVRVTIGDLYKNTPMYITNVSYSWDSETPWEIETGNQLPLYTDVDISLGWIGEKRPDYSTANIYG